MSLDLSSQSLKNKVSKNEYGTYSKIKDIMAKADRPASMRKSNIGVATNPPFSFDPIVDHVFRL